MKKILALLLALLLLTGCASAPQTAAPETVEAPAAAQSAVQTEQALAEIRSLGTSPDDNYRTWYEIFVWSFCDSDGDGIGDLNGVISKLDYLQELGVNGIWLMPIHPSVSYHKYNVSDYYAIDPDYGTMEDFEALMAECQKRDIHVILDLVVNHSGNVHPWFTQAAEYLRNLGDQEPDSSQCPYVDYYFFAKEPLPGYNQIPDSIWYYESRFSPEMPDLNLGSEAVREEIEAIMKFWLDKGVAGFRLDAVKEFYSGTTTKNIEVLNWIQTTGEALKEDIYFVAEAWDSFGTITTFYESGITSMFNFPFGDASGKIISVIRGAGNPSVVSTYATALEKADTAYSGANPDYIDAPFLSNHDIGRIAGFCAGDSNKTKLAGAMNLFMSGSAFIYYGEEIGMTGSGNDPSKRAPMYWNAARDAGTTNLPPECILPERYPFPSLEDQKADDSSIYNYYRQAIAIRQALPVISHGKTTAEAPLNTGCVSAFRKTWNDTYCIVLMNISEEIAKVDLSGYADWNMAAKLSADGSEICLNGSELSLAPWGIAILIP